MDHLTNAEQKSTEDSLSSRRESRGYSHEELAIATGLTVAEIRTVEEGGGPPDHQARIESVLR